VRRDEADAIVAVLCGVLYLLMLSRLWDVASSYRRGLVRERKLLAAMGCQYGQGYLLSVPVEAAQAEELLSRGLGLAPSYPGSGRRPPGRSSLPDL
jgi:hypothetical protein